MARRIIARYLVPGLLAVWAGTAGGAALRSAPPAEDLLVSRAEVGRYGGQLVLSQSAEPKTLNPVTVVDIVSRTVIRCTTADLIRLCRTPDVKFLAALGIYIANLRQYCVTFAQQAGASHLLEMLRGVSD